MTKHKQLYRVWWKFKGRNNVDAEIYNTEAAARKAAMKLRRDVKIISISKVYNTMNGWEFEEIARFTAADVRRQRSR